tara:strand:+ start:61 stop:534 length:474 start_codon:yes stop_codon:yes gene_type:complete
MPSVIRGSDDLDSGKIVTPDAFIAHTANALTIPNSTPSKVVFSATDLNRNSIYNASNGTFTVSEAGLYLITSQCLVAKGYATRVDIIFHKNGAWVDAKEVNPIPSTASNYSVEGTTYQYLNAGDTIEVYVQIVGASGSLYVASGQTQFNRFAAAKIG